MSRVIRLRGETASLSAIGLGAMPLSLQGRPDEATAMRVIRTYLEGGGNFIDTANVYCSNEHELGHNENLIHRAVKSSGRDDVYIATKGGLRMHGDNWTVDASPAWLRMSCEQSLMNLNSACIFLYQLHAPDPDIDILESVGELMRMQAEGMIRHIGLSNVTRQQLRRVVEMTDILAVQNCCNLFDRADVDSGLLEMCREQQIVFIAHSPVGGHYDHARLMQNTVLREIAEKFDSTAYCVALAWLLNQGEHVLAIPGASRPDSIRNSLSALDINLDAEDLARLDQLGA